MLSVTLSSRTFCEQVARRFERLLEQFNCVRQLALSNCRLDPPTVVRLCHVLQLNTSLYSLDMARTQLADDGAMLLAHALLRNPSLRMLGLAGNGLTGRGCRLLIRAIGKGRVLLELDLGDNRIGDTGCRALAQLLGVSNCPLRRLVVANNAIGVPGGSALFAALRGNSRLTHVDISRNEIGDESSRELATALIYNRTLRHLAATDCGLTTTTCCALARPLQTNTVLRDLILDENDGICDAGVEAIATSLRYNRSLRVLSFNHCRLTPLSLTHVVTAVAYNNTIRQVDIRPSGSCHQPPLPSNRVDYNMVQLSNALRVNPLMRILA